MPLFPHAKKSQLILISICYLINYLFIIRPLRPMYLCLIAVTILKHLYKAAEQRFHHIAFSRVCSGNFFYHTVNDIKKLILPDCIQKSEVRIYLGIIERIFSVLLKKRWNTEPTA